MHLNYHVRKIIIVRRDRYIGCIFIKLRILYIFSRTFLEVPSSYCLGEYRIFTSISFVSMTSSPRSSYVCTSLVCVRGAQPNMADTGRTTCVHACHPVHAQRYGFARVHASCVSCVSVQMWRCDHTRAHKGTNSLVHVNGDASAIFCNN